MVWSVQNYFGTRVRVWVVAALTAAVEYGNG
jgi:hypothetical protein